MQYHERIQKGQHTMKSCCILKDYDIVNLEAYKCDLSESHTLENRADC